MGKVDATYWTAAIAAALGRDPSTPEEALEVLGNLLRSNPAEKEKFKAEAYAAWVGGGWVSRGDNTPTARIALAALAEATRRLADRYGWERGEEEPEIRLPKEIRERLRVVRASSPGEGVFFVPSQGLSDKAVWAAVYRLLQGKQVILVPRKGTGEEVILRSRRMILEEVLHLLLKKEEENTVRMPWGERVKILPGDRWESLDKLEPRVAHAIKGLRLLVQDWELEEGEKLLRWEQEERPYLLSWVHHDPDKRVVAPMKYPSTWELVVRKAATFSPPTYGEVRQVFAKPSWAALRVLTPLVAYEVSELGFKDLEVAYQEGILTALRIWERLKKKEEKKEEKEEEVNPLVYLVPELRKELLELRAKEVGVVQLPREVARKVRKYFALIHEGESPEKAAKKAGLPQELVQTGQLSADELAEVGAEPSEEVDYDTYLLRVRVKEVREEIGRWFGAPGVAFVDALMDGASIEGAQVRSRINPELASQIVDYLRSELEGWAD